MDTADATCAKRRRAPSRSPKQPAASFSVKPHSGAFKSAMHKALFETGYFVFEAIRPEELPTKAEIDAMRQLTLITDGNVGGFAFNERKALGAGDGSRRLAFVRSALESKRELPACLIPLFEQAEKKVLDALPDVIEDTVTRSIYWNVDSVPADPDVDAFAPADPDVRRVPAKGNPPHIDVVELDAGVIGHVSAGHLPPVTLWISLEGFVTRFWPGGHDVLLRDAVGALQTARLPLPDREVYVPPGHCAVVRFDLPHAGGTLPNLRLCTVVGSATFPRPLLGDGSGAYADNVNFDSVGQRHDLFKNARAKRSKPILASESG